MSNNNESGTTRRKIIPILLLFGMLGIFLSLYFWKYIPQQQDGFNGRAFLELGQIEKAIQSKNDGYTRAIQIFINHAHAGNPLLESFTFNSPLRPYLKEEGGWQVRPTLLSKDTISGSWQITYPLYHQKGYKATDDSSYLSIRLENVLAPIISTYKDIFEDYLLIRDAPPDGGIIPAGQKDRPHQGEIVFNSGMLSMDYLVNTDSLLRKNDGFSLLNMNNVTVEGNSYKLFLYPFQLGKERIILAGLISLARYKESYKNIPFSLIALTSIIILVLLIHLPILKVYILGIFERITDFDIRLIIGSYFIAAFTGFFLFSWVFLRQALSADKRDELNAISLQVQKSFVSETERICIQLQKWDTLYARNIRPQHRRLELLHYDSPTFQQDSAHLDSLFHPDHYPYADIVFWIDSTGKWVASWSEKKSFNRPVLLNVADRKYFRDFVQKEYLRLPGTGTPFTIQPTLSKLDGEYTITIVIESLVSRREIKDTVLTTSTKRDTSANRDTVRRPFLIGLSAEMYTVTNTLLPCGYNFSIINDTGDILYDSKPGRALLSNILKESGDPSSLLGCARFRIRRHFNSFTLKGQQVALLATPIHGFPYTLIVYSDLSGNDDFMVHLIGLSAFFAGCVLALLILSTLINEWTGKKPRLLLAPYRHFAWLRPVPEKTGYYRHLITGMLCLLVVYLVAWLVVETMARRSEFCLFFLSLLFPFYVALYYYILRQKQEETELPRSLLPVLTFLAVVILVINCFAYWGSPSTLWIPGIILIVQAFFLATLFICLSREKNKTPDGNQASLRGNTSLISGKTSLKYYTWAILTGVFMISIVLACGIFWILFRQEVSLQSNSSRLETAKGIDQRRAVLNKQRAAYKFYPGNQTGTNKDSVILHQRKFQYGIFLLHGDTIIPGNWNWGPPYYPVATQYDRLHRLFFTKDSTILAWSATPQMASDSSWYFLERDGNNTIGAELDYDNKRDRVNNVPLKFGNGPEASWSAFYLFIKELGSANFLFNFLFLGGALLSVFLAYKLTFSLATRIFLLGVFRGTPRPEPLPATVPVSPIPPIPPEVINEERALGLNLVTSQEIILCNLSKFEEIYQRNWNGLTEMEKFVLYDFAKDGFTNYKTGSILYSLQNRGVLQLRDEGLEFITPSFREYVLRQGDDPAIGIILKKAGLKGPWQTFRMPLLILLSTFGLFIFFTQDALYQKIVGLLASLISLHPLLSPFLNKSNGKEKV